MWVYTCEGVRVYVQQSQRGILLNSCHYAADCEFKSSSLCSLDISGKEKQCSEPNPHHIIHSLVQTVSHYCKPFSFKLVKCSAESKIRMSKKRNKKMEDKYLLQRENLKIISVMKVILLKILLSPRGVQHVNWSLCITHHWLL